MVNRRVSVRVGVLTAKAQGRKGYAETKFQS